MLENLWYPSTQSSPWWWSCATVPLAQLYHLGLRCDQRHTRKHQHNLPRPVISVGNLTVGGTGKSPVALWLADYCFNRGVYPCILSRGYGASASQPRMVDPGATPLAAVGDEPLMLAQRLAGGVVAVGRDRFAAGNFALQQDPGIGVFILDDGFQHLALARDLDLVLIDSMRGFGSGRLLPQGPLREPIAALARASALLLVNKTADPDAMVASPGGYADGIPDDRLDGFRELLKDTDVPDTRCFDVVLAPIGWRAIPNSDLQPLETLPVDLPVRLVSGIGSPDSFEKVAENSGLAVVHHSIYRDHHAFTPQEILSELEQTRTPPSRLVTTAKDAVRMQAVFSDWTRFAPPIIIEIGVRENVSLTKFGALLDEVLTGDIKGNRTGVAES